MLLLLLMNFQRQERERGDPFRSMAAPIGHPLAPIGEGLSHAVDDVLGRIVIATRAFALGEVVMTDHPLIVFKSDDFASYLAAFSAASPIAQAAVLDMCHPPLNKKTNQLVRKHKVVATRLQGSHGLDEAQIHKLLMIRDTNCHAYSGKECAYGSDQQGDVTGMAALFERGSKVAHSCEPNLYYTSKNRHGGLEFRTCRPIAAGDMISFSYIGQLWTKSTLDRRAECLETKDFLCCCRRCVGPDMTSAFCCPTALCPGFATPRINLALEASESAEALIWECGESEPFVEDPLAQPPSPSTSFLPSPLTHHPQHQHCRGIPSLSHPHPNHRPPAYLTLRPYA